MYRSISSKLVMAVKASSYPVSDSETRGLVRETLGFLNEGVAAQPAALALAGLTAIEKAQSLGSHIGVAVPQNMNLTSVTVRDPIAPEAYTVQSHYYVSEFFGNLGSPVAEAAQAHNERKDLGASKFRRALNLCARTWGLVGTKTYVETALKYGLRLRQDGVLVTSADQIRSDGSLSHDYVGMMQN